MPPGNSFRTSVPRGVGPATGRAILAGTGRLDQEHVIDHMVTQRYRRLAAVNGRLLAILRAAELDGRRESP
jgi:O-acetyl-ADP-ribose deacetylase (regulator of RNase III)